MSSPAAEPDHAAGAMTADVAAAKDDGNGDAIWLMTFLNLLLVLLALFISLVSHKHFSKDAKKAKPAKPAVKPDEAAAAVRQRRERARALRKKLAELLKRQGFSGARVDLHRGAPRIILASGVVFESGSADLTRVAKQRLAAVGHALSSLKNMIVVEGHTDDRPISTPRFPSNWELSTARALAVVRLFITGGLSPSRLEFAGYGEFRPQEPNNTEENRRANRRIEIKVR